MGWYLLLYFAIPLKDKPHLHVIRHAVVNEGNKEEPVLAASAACSTDGKPNGCDLLEESGSRLQGW